MKKVKILVVDDEKDIIELVFVGLSVLVFGLCLLVFGLCLWSLGSGPSNLHIINNIDLIIGTFFALNEKFSQKICLLR